jgi:hypothetical protein
VQPAHHRRERWELGQLLDLPIQLIAALEFVHQERVVLAIDEPVVHGERGALRGQVLQPAEVRRAPVGALADDEPPAGEALQEVVA